MEALDYTCLLLLKNDACEWAAQTRNSDEREKIVIDNDGMPGKARSG